MDIDGAVFPDAFGNLITSDKLMKIQIEQQQILDSIEVENAKQNNKWFDSKSATKSYVKVCTAVDDSKPAAKPAVKVGAAVDDSKPEARPTPVCAV